MKLMQTQRFLHVGEGKEGKQRDGSKVNAEVRALTLRAHLSGFPCDPGARRPPPAPPGLRSMSALMLKNQNPSVLSRRGRRDQISC